MSVLRKNKKKSAVFMTVIEAKKKIGIFVCMFVHTSYKI